jgi:hypothetical protein
LSVDAFQASPIDVGVEPVIRKPAGFDGAVVSPLGAVAGRSATSCPIVLSCVELVVATFSPVAPAFAWTRSAPSERTAPQPGFVETS